MPNPTLPKTAQEKYNYFKPENWKRVQEDSRTVVYVNSTNDRIHESGYEYQQKFRKEYEEKLQLLHDFRLEHLPLGEYPDYTLLETLNKHYEKIWRK